MNCYIWCMFLVVFLLSVHVFVCMCVYMFTQASTLMYVQKVKFSDSTNTN